MCFFARRRQRWLQWLQDTELDLSERGKQLWQTNHLGSKLPNEELWKKKEKSRWKEKRAKKLFRWVNWSADELYIGGFQSLELRLGLGFVSSPIGGFANSQPQTHPLATNTNTKTNTNTNPQKNIINQKDKHQHKYRQLKRQTRSITRSIQCASAWHPVPVLHQQ